jgi:hypothetical protein
MAIFSLQELDLASDPSWALIKSRVMEKVVEQMGEIEKALKVYLRNSTFSFPEGTKLRSGKISKGENYKGLPYVVLDYPALFNKEDIFSYRIMFLWGHHISYSLHLQGYSLHAFQSHFLNNYANILPKQTRFYIYESPWENFNNDYFYTDLFTEETIFITSKIEQHEFLKISNFEPIESIENSSERACHYLQHYLLSLS